MKLTTFKKISYCSFLVLFSLVYNSCASYRVKSEKIETALKQGEIKQALKSVDANSFLKKKRNLLLYYFEKGKILYLNGEYELSNSFLNKADAFIEENKEYIGGKVLGVLLNPETETYTGEDFEKVAIHYYKALNYIFLNKLDDALVEAKRINIKLQEINDTYPIGKKNRYTSDGFALNIQGLLYEASGDINNAFISYRNAVDLYVANDGYYFGTPLPEQLKNDVLRTAASLGFTNELLRYEKLLETTYVQTDENTGGELILFWENGLVPYKDQTLYNFTVLPGNRDGIVSIYNEDLGITLPIPVSTGNETKKEFSDIDVFSVAFPKYVKRNPYYSNATVNKDSVRMNFQLAQNYNVIAFKTLKDRALREIGKAAIRLGTKKISEYLLREENDDLGAALGIFNALTEHADTRNWQSLPQDIYYARIPLKDGENTISITLTTANGVSKEQTIQVKGRKGIQFKKIITLQSL